MLKLSVVLSAFAVATYFAILIALYALQGKLLFPAPVRGAFQLPSTANIVAVEVDNGVILEHIRLPNIPNSPRVLFFHGNGSLASYELQRGLELNRAGFDVLLVEYRGYGGNTGTPSADVLLADSLKTFDLYVADHQDDIFLYALSLGTGIATYVASQRKITALALESAYGSLAAVAADHYPIFPVRLLFRNEINSLSFAEKIKEPMLLIHGEKDRVIPIEHGRKLFAGIKSPGKEWVQLPEAGHNNLLAFNSIDHVIKHFKENMLTQ